MCMIKSCWPRRSMALPLCGPKLSPTGRSICAWTKGTPVSRSNRKCGSAVTFRTCRPSGAPASTKHRRTGKARRWKVERTHSWVNRARRLLIRWEKKVSNYFGFLHLQFAIVALRTAGVLG